MTALKKYARIEASGLWRASAQEQRCEVVVSIGDATLIISDLRDRAITHWSLAAVQRSNPGKRPAIFHPEGDPDETLEIDASEVQMIEAIETLRRAVEKTRPRPGRLRWLGMTLSLAAVAAVGVFWVPGALVDHALTVVPHVKRQEIGEALLMRIERLSGSACAETSGLQALRKLRGRLGTGPLSIMPGNAAPSLHLPGGRILLDRSLVEDHEEPDVVAGYALAEHVLAQNEDPLAALLRSSGTWASFQLLTTGSLEPDTLDRYAQTLLTNPRPEPETDAMLSAFAMAQVRSTPYAYAVDVTGESVLPLIEADPMSGANPSDLLSDADWIRLQSICGG
jgi:hypothetical protein